MHYCGVVALSKYNPAVADAFAASKAAAYAVATLLQSEEGAAEQAAG